MAIFPFIECDDIVQVADKFRISAVKSYVSKGEESITLVEIEPDTGLGFIEVQGAGPTLNSKNFWLDWQYETDGEKVITLRITTDGTPVELTKTVSCLSEVDDYLFSKDNELVAIESDVLKYVPEGRNTFKFIHREAQSEILEWLYNKGYTKYNGERFLKEDVINISEVNYWAKYTALRLIYEDLSNQNNDVFKRKAKDYENQAAKWRDKAVLKIDRNGDGTQGVTEGYDMNVRILTKE